MNRITWIWPVLAFVAGAGVVGGFALLDSDRPEPKLVTTQALKNQDRLPSYGGDAPKNMRERFDFVFGEGE